MRKESILTVAGFEEKYATPNDRYEETTTENEGYSYSMYTDTIAARSDNNLLNA